MESISYPLGPEAGWGLQQLEYPSGLKPLLFSNHLSANQGEKPLSPL
jgi:hypothetical protein